MVEFFKTIDGRITEINEFSEGCWVNMVHPSSDELAQIAKAVEVVRRSSSVRRSTWRKACVDTYDEQPFMIVDIPMVEKSSVEDGGQLFSTTPMGIVVAKSAVITVCLEDSIILRSIAEGAVKGVHTALRTRFVFQILLRIAGRFLKNLRMIERDFTRIEKRLYDSLKNEELIQLLGLSKSLVYFSSSLKGNEVTMEKVPRGRVLKLDEDDRDILEDALIEVRQAIEMANIYSNIMAGTMDAYASVALGNNLTIITGEGSDHLDHHHHDHPEYRSAFGEYRRGNIRRLGLVDAALAITVIGASSRGICSRKRTSTEFLQE